jgi:hypothetical protein
MCVEDHHTILKASEDLDKAFSKTLDAVNDLSLMPGTGNELMLALQQLERVTRYLQRKAKVIARTQP